MSVVEAMGEALAGELLEPGVCVRENACYGMDEASLLWLCFSIGFRVQIC
jgi:hypothetical protein